MGGVTAARAGALAFVAALAWARLAAAEPVEAEPDLELFAPELQLDPGIAFDAWVDVAKAVGESERSKGDVFTPERFPFCTEGYRAPRPDLVLCELALDADVEICPGIATLCTSGPAPAPQSTQSSLLQWIIGGLALVALVMLGGRAVRLALTARPVKSREQPSSHDEVDLVAPRVARRLPTGPAHAIIERAEQRARDGDGSGALELVQAGLQRWIQDTGLLAFRPSLTHRDYLARLDAHPELRALYREVARLEGRLHFGDGRVDAAKVDAVLLRAKSWVLQPTSALPAAPRPSVVGFWPLLATLALGAMAACGGGVAEPSFHGHRPRDLAALPALLAQADIPVEVRPRIDPEEMANVGVIVYRTSRARANAELSRALVTARALGYPIVALDDAQRPERFDPALRVELRPSARSVRYELTREFTCGLELESVAAFVDPAAFDLPTPALVRWAPTATASPDDEVRRPLGFPAGDPDEEDEASFGVVSTSSRAELPGDRAGCFVYFPSSAYFSNAALLRAENRTLAVALIGSLLMEGEDAIFVDGATSEGAGSSDLPSSLGRTRATPLFLQLGALLVLLIWAVGTPFGPLRERDERRRRAFVDHARAIGVHYRHNGPRGELHAARVLARAVIRRRGERLPHHDFDGWMRRAEQLARRHDADPEAVRTGVLLGLEGARAEAMRAETVIASPLDVAELLSKILGDHGNREKNDEPIEHS